MGSLLAAPLDVEVESTPEVDDLDPSFRRARLHGVVARSWDCFWTSPTLLLFEDVHWMDDASSELLRHLGTQLSTRPWLACTTRRGVEGGFAAAEGTPPLPALTLRLEPLPVEDAKTLVQAAVGDRRLNDDELAALMERGAGNPLFLQELATPGDASVERTRCRTPSRDSSDAIDKLAPGDRALLRWASVLGESFSERSSRVCSRKIRPPRPTPRRGTGSRVRRARSRRSGAFRFRHALIRDGAYEGLSFKRRRELHGRVADVVEAQLGDRANESAELLSLHYDRAGNSAKSWQYSLAAGERAQAEWANLEAVEFYRRAIDVAAAVRSSPNEIARVWQALGDCLHLPGRLDDAAEAYTAAREFMPKRSREHIELSAKEGLLRDDMGRYPDAIHWYRRALKATEAIPEKTRAAGSGSGSGSSLHRRATGREHSGLHPTVQGGRPGVP